MYIKVSVLILFVFYLISSPIYAQSCDDDTQCEAMYNGDPYVECISGACQCMDFFVIHQRYDRCLKGASIGKKCEPGQQQCQIILGEQSRCNAAVDAGTCECYSAAGGENASVTFYHGKCYLLKGFGEACSEDYQCMLDVNGTVFNPLGRCIEKTCACYNDTMIASTPMHGMCMVQCADCKIVNISVLAVTLGGAVALGLFVYVMYRVAVGDKPKEEEVITIRKDNHSNHNGTAPASP